MNVKKRSTDAERIISDVTEMSELTQVDILLLRFFLTVILKIFDMHYLESIVRMALLILRLLLEHDF